MNHPFSRRLTNYTPPPLFPFRLYSTLTAFSAARSGKCKFLQTFQRPRAVQYSGMPVCMFIEIHYKTVHYIIIFLASLCTSSVGLI